MTSFKSAFLFSNIKFFSDAIKLAFAKDSIQTHVFESFDSMEYFIQDLAPDIFIIEIEGFKDHLKMIEHLKAITPKPIVLVGTSAIETNLIFIKKPINPMNFKDLIEAKMNLSH